MIVFAHISDTHFDGGERALGRVRRVMAYLRPMPLDAILVTGDIADHGAPHEYEQARAELTADVPVLVLPGNHDELTWRTTIDLDHPPSVAFHVLDDDRRLTTHYRVAP